MKRRITIRNKNDIRRIERQIKKDYASNAKRMLKGQKPINYDYDLSIKF